MTSDHDFSALSALVIDENAMARDAFIRFLSELKLRRVDQATGPDVARRMLATSAVPYDIVVCDALF